MSLEEHVNHCGCGCGAVVRRRFLPGHDSRLHAQERREASRTGVQPATRANVLGGWERDRKLIKLDVQAFGQICRDCLHEGAAHGIEDGRAVCLFCHDSKARVHLFRALLADGPGIFKEDDGGSEMN